MKEKIEPTKIWTNVYVVQNYGTFRGLFYRLKDAKDFVEKEGYADGKYIYQIYKGRVTFDVQRYI